MTSIVADSPMLFPITTAKTADKNMKTIFTIVDGNSVQVLRPNRKGDKYRQLPDDPEDLDAWDDLTDEEIDELFG